MYAFILHRILASILTLLGLTLLTFALLQVIPGSVIDNILGLEGQASEARVAQLREEFGLDDPPVTRYVTWLGALAQGDFGTSWRFDRPVLDLILERMPLTLELAILSMLVALSLGIPLGVAAALQPGSLIDHGTRLVALAGSAVPSFFLGALALYFLSVTFQWIPPTGYISPVEDPIGNFTMMIIPALVLGLSSAAVILRMTRASMLDVLSRDLMRTAQSKGLPERTIVVRHALRNALIPIITIAAVQAGTLLGGTIVTENVFSLAGMGRMLSDGIAQRDYPVVQGVVVVIGALFLLANFIADVMYAMVDPRVRLS